MANAFPRALAAALLGLAGCGLAPPPRPPAATPSETGRHVLAASDDPNAVDTRLYARGEARAATGPWWAFSTSLGQAGAAAPVGVFLIASSQLNRTLMGTVTSGQLARNAAGGGVADLVGTLTTGASVTLRFTDANATAAFDGFTIQTTGLSFTGEVRHGAVRLLRALPAAQPARTGFRFEPRIGLYVAEEDLNREVAPAPDVLPPAVLEVTRPDPVIDFNEDRPGGIISAPGSEDNVPH